MNVAVYFCGLPMLCRLAILFAFALLCNLVVATESAKSNRHLDALRPADLSLTCSDHRSFAINAKSPSRVVICYNPGNNTVIKFSFKSVFWLPLSSLDWTLYSDTNVALATATQYASHGEGSITLQNDYKWVALHLTCWNNNMACQGSADIAGSAPSALAVHTLGFGPITRPVKPSSRPKKISTSPDCYSYQDTNVIINSNSYFEFCQNDIHYLVDGSTIGNVTWSVDANSHFAWLHWGWSFGPGSCGNSFNEEGKARLWDDPSGVASVQYGDQPGYGYWTLHLECSNAFMGCTIPSVWINYCVYN